MKKTTKDLIEKDRRYLWHPFTQMREWCDTEFEPLVIARGKGAWLWDTEGRKYLDGNSSIWTNIHGHAHPVLNEALRTQAEKISHCSALGFTNEPAIALAEALVKKFPQNTLTKVFYSDDGSTAMECALKMATQYRQLQGQSERNGFLAFHNAYHGDTMGAASLVGVGKFADRFRAYGYPVTHVSDMSAVERLSQEQIQHCNAIVIEPLVQGVNQIHVWEKGLLQKLRAWCDRHDILLIFDEVMTGFGRTGTLFACQQENVTPDLLCLAKGISGGYMPLAATLTTEKIYHAFLGGDERTLYYGHSYTANPLACAVGLASLELFEHEKTLENLQPKIAHMTELLTDLQKNSPHISAVRQCGFIAGIDIVQKNGKPYPAEQKTGAQLCHAMRQHHLLTRPIRDTLVLMPPLCTSQEELEIAVQAIEKNLPLLQRY